MKSVLIFILSQSIFLPLIAGLAAFRRIGRVYRPFFFFILTGVLSELINDYLIKVRHTTNAPISNVYALAECMLLCWQFHVWGLLRSGRIAFFFLLGSLFLIWVFENVVFGQINEFPPYFRVLYNGLIVLFSINKINFMITHENRNLFSNPQFLICITFIIFFIYKILYEWAYQNSVTGTSGVTETIIMLFGYINALANVLFAIAILLIPAPRKFTLR